MKKYDDLIDRLTLYFTADAFRDELTSGKKLFFDEAGIMDEENHAFEMRMTQFLEWYLFSRPLTRSGLVPAHFALELADFKMTAQERPDFENLAIVWHSLFEFQKTRGDDIYIRDLFLDKQVVIHDSPIRVGFNRGEIFDARLISNGEDYMFTRGFCFHPIEASTYILGEIKKLRKTENHQATEAFMLKLLKMRYKYEQYRHLKLDYVYTNEKKMRF